ncbi:Phenylacetate-CoA oxygenase, PaaJ subunit [Burkholderia singularis]|uniref:Phenylacetate-CoA oxygenase, PaaJ subunit n=1 Tax=Burkholderia singularis TaxID=1503053 RepID=A0A238HC35_9BURK|nr:Phenylacetate-CoA oxygenase, PaaJ subunit [Burkholderia singularis]
MMKFETTSSTLPPSAVSGPPALAPVTPGRQKQASGLATRPSHRSIGETGQPVRDPDRPGPTAPSAQSSCAGGLPAAGTDRSATRPQWLAAGANGSNTAHDDETLVARARQALESVPDPEIPVVSIRELGILRDVRRAPDGTLEIVITPTYSGCPAMQQIADDIGAALRGAGLAPHRIVTVLAPAWTTDWITADAREKLRAYGIAPPAERCDGHMPGSALAAAPAAERTIRFVPKPAAPKPVVANSAAAPACPRCGSAHTERLAQFGSTACKALYRCIDCREPFDYFKPY